MQLAKLFFASLFLILIVAGCAFPKPKPLFEAPPVVSYETAVIVGELRNNSGVFITAIDETPLMYHGTELKNANVSPAYLAKINAPMFPGMQHQISAVYFTRNNERKNLTLTLDVLPGEHYVIRTEEIENSKEISYWIENKGGKKVIGIEKTHK